MIGAVTLAIADAVRDNFRVGANTIKLDEVHSRKVVKIKISLVDHTRNA